MQEAVCIASTANPRIKRVLSVRQQGPRHDSGLMIVEGAREIRRAILNAHFPVELFVREDAREVQALADILKCCSQHATEVTPCTDRVFEKLAYREGTVGIIGLFPRIQHELGEVHLSSDAILIIAERIEKPGNLGAILRSADASGVAAVIVCDGGVDVCNPNVVRASIGTVFSLPVVQCNATHLMPWIREQQIKLFAASPTAAALYTEQDYSGRVGLIVGAEHQGLSEVLFDKSDVQVRIPMHGQADSLNVANATSILLYEVLRQRHVNS